MGIDYEVDEDGFVGLEEGEYVRLRAIEAALTTWLENEAWSLLRQVLEQGRAIQQDYEAGRYPSYEHLSARIDEAARERAEYLRAALGNRCSG